MEKEFIPYEQALALKELGFDEQCLALYDLDGKITIEFVNWKNAKNRKSNYLIATPLYQQSFRWFREKYNLHSQTPSTCVEWSVRIFYNNPIYDELDSIVFDSMEQYTSYEEAELECLKKLIEIVKDGRS